MAPSERTQESTLSAQKCSTKSILVIDDDLGVLELVETVLGDYGYRVRTAPDGRAGLERVEDEMPHLILLDLKMPLMDGWEFAREFHRRYGVQAPIVVLTAIRTEEEGAEVPGAAGTIAKPFDLSALVDAVRRHTP